MCFNPFEALFGGPDLPKGPTPAELEAQRAAEEATAAAEERKRQAKKTGQRALISDDPEGVPRNDLGYIPPSLR